MNIFKTLFGTPQYVSQTDTRADSPDPDPADIWLFTDPDARENFINEGRLQDLEHDIKNEVMRAGLWQPDELEYKREIRRLLREGVISDKGSYWYASPFPTVYRANKYGSFRINGNEYKFWAGEDIVFQCRMTRDMTPQLTGPVLISRLQPTNKSMLCGQMGGAMKGLGNK
jgi:hypothetical protein